MPDDNVDIDATLDDIVIAHLARENFLLKQKLKQAASAIHGFSEHLVSQAETESTDK